MADINLALTTAGQALKAKIEMGEGSLPLDITRIVTASGTSPDPLNLTAVVDEKQTFSITKKTTTGPRTEFRAMLTNMGNPAKEEPPLTDGYLMAQIGWYANDPDDGEILYRISQFEVPNYVPAARERGWVYEPTFNIITGNASEVIVNIDPSGLVTMQDFTEHVDAPVVSESGIHGIRFFEGVLEVFFGGEWIPAAGTPTPPGEDTQAVLGASFLGIAYLDGSVAYSPEPMAAFLQTENGELISGTVQLENGETAELVFLPVNSGQ